MVPSLIIERIETSVFHWLANQVDPLRSPATMLDLPNIHIIAAATNPEVAPNLDFMDCGGHGYVIIAAHESFLDAELVCLPRPIERAAAADGGPLRYRVSYRSPIWKPG